MIINVHWSSCKVPVILVRFYGIWNFLEKFSNPPPNNKFHEHLTNGSQVVPGGPKDRPTDMTKLTDSGLSLTPRLRMQ